MTDVAKKAREKTVDYVVAVEKAPPAKPDQ
jgi:hypothetical protein